MGLETEPSAMNHRAPDQSPQDITPPLIRGDDPVRHEHGGAPRMVGHDPKRRIHLSLRPIRPSGFLLPVFDQRPEKVRFKNTATLSVDDGGDALQAHPGVDTLACQRRPVAGLVAVPLDEHQVPDLEEPVAAGVLAIRTAVRHPTPMLLAPVVVDLGVRTAGPGWTGRPEVEFVAKATNARVRNACLLPDLIALVILVVNPGPQTPRLDSEFGGQKLIRVWNRLLLEVVAEGEVAQHLEEGEMVAVVANDVDVR